MREKIVNFDSINAIPDYAFVKPTDTYSQDAILTLNKYNASWKLVEPISNVKAVSLLGFTFPFLFPNIRKANNSNRIGLTVNGTTYYTYIPERIYTSINDLLSVINSYMVFDMYDIQFSLHNNHSVMITTGIPSLIIEEGILMTYILGYKKNLDIFLDQGSKRVIYCVNKYNMNPDDYVNFVIKDISPVSSINANGARATFNLPLNGSSGNVIYWSNQMGYEQTIYINQSNFNVDVVKYEIMDRFGFPLYYFNGEFSITLKYFYE